MCKRSLNNGNIWDGNMFCTLNKHIVNIIYLHTPEFFGEQESGKCATLRCM